MNKIKEPEKKYTVREYYYAVALAKDLAYALSNYIDMNNKNSAELELIEKASRI